jgi:hypothetical protein
MQTETTADYPRDKLTALLLTIHAIRQPSCDHSVLPQCVSLSQQSSSSLSFSLCCPAWSWPRQEEVSVMFVYIFYILPWHGPHIEIIKFGAFANARNIDVEHGVFNDVGRNQYNIVHFSLVSDILQFRFLCLIFILQVTYNYRAP